MEETFNKLKKEHKNVVDNLIKWMQDSKLVGKDKTAEDKARKLFEDVKDTSNVEFEKFKEAVSKLATEQKKNAEDLASTLAAEGAKFFDAIMAAASTAASVGASTFSEKMAKK